QVELNGTRRNRTGTVTWREGCKSATYHGFPIPSLQVQSLSRLPKRPNFRHLPCRPQATGARRHDPRGSFTLMQAHRVLIETDEHGRPKDLPVLPPHAKVEAIFLVLEEGANVSGERRPPASLAGL